MLEHSDVKILRICLVSYNTSHTFNILGCLLFHDLHNVIDGYYTHKPVLIIHYRKCQEAVLLEGIRHLLLVIIHIYINVIRVHQFGNKSL